MDSGNGHGGTLCVPGKAHPGSKDPKRRYWLLHDLIIMVIDGESIGIHGEVYAGGYTTINRQGGLVDLSKLGLPSEDWWSCPAIMAAGAPCPAAERAGRAAREPLAQQEEQDRRWGLDNVPPEVHEGQGCETPREVRDRFWDVWMKLKAHFGERLMVAAECTWPVEAGFLSACIADDPTRKRHWEGPHPVLDISAVLLAAGMDPTGWFERTENEPEHHPLGDARQSARLLVEALNRCERGWRSQARECSDCTALGRTTVAVAAHPLDRSHGICQEHLDGLKEMERQLEPVSEE